MKKLEAIVAVYADWGIGAAGTQPLTLRADRRRFREVTAGAAVIVGRRTLADFPGGQPLKGRVNIVLTRRNGEIPGAVVVHSVNDALTKAAQYERAIVIGGGSVYQALLPYVHRAYVTKIDAYPPSDTFFPNLDVLPDWAVTASGSDLTEDGVTYRFLVYERCADYCG